jgi:hypothetical protein
MDTGNSSVCPINGKITVYRGGNGIVTSAPLVRGAVNMGRPKSAHKRRTGPDELEEVELQGMRQERCAYINWNV